MTIERLFLSLSILSFSVMANDTAQWVTGVNSTSIDEFKTSDPTELPNYPTTSTGNEAYLGNEVGMANDAATQATTDEGAQLIHGIPARPNVNNEQWYQNAQDVTANPSDYVDTVDADYTDCEEVTQEGDEYTETQACTVSRIGSTATCSQGRLLEVDASHLYSCNKELSTSNGNCSIGREIDVTQLHRYSCETGEKTRLKQCVETLDITVDKTIYKYPPQAICSFSEADYTNHDLDRNFLQIPKSTNFHFETQEFESGFAYYKKEPDSCSIYSRTYSYGIDSGFLFRFSGTESIGCRQDDDLWDDGLCHSNTPIELTPATGSCTDGDLDEDACIPEPAWVTEYRGPGYASTDIRAGRSGWGKVNMTWCLRDGSGACYIWQDKNRHKFIPGFTMTAALNKTVEGYPPTAQLRLGAAKGAWSHGIIGYAVSILLSSNEVNVPEYNCDSSSPPVAGTNMCHSMSGHPEFRINENWINSCNHQKHTF